MTYDKYISMHEGIYKPKHEKQMYHVWLVCGPAGPVKEYDVFGLEEANKSISGGWDYTITRIYDGKAMKL